MFYICKNRTDCLDPCIIHQICCSRAVVVLSFLVVLQLRICNNSALVGVASGFASFVMELCFLCTVSSLRFLCFRLNCDEDESCN